MSRFPESGSADLALAPRDIVRSGLCIGCGACAAAQSNATMAWDRYGQLKPRGPREWYRRRTAEFARLCPFSPAAADEDRIAKALFPEAPSSDANVGRFAAAYVGHVDEGEYRRNGSSGGMTSWVAAELLRSGRVDAVAHVAPRGGDRLFGYQISRSVDTVQAGAKSRYYPIDLSDVICEIRTTPGRYAIVGVPCFIKAIQLLRREDPLIRERVTHTLGLVCGHMKSARLVESFAWQLGAELGQVRSIDYRIKDESRPANWYRAEIGLADGGKNAGDWWNFVDGDWGAGFFQNSACNACDDVVAETADISMGDAWVEPYSSDGRGTNVVIVRSPELLEMVEQAIADGRLRLQPVGADFVAQTQAAGLRHRREGLAYRLGWHRRGLPPSKRVAAGAPGLPLRRRLIYRSRALISVLSHRVFALARALRTPSIYIRWGRLALAIYQGLTYSRGRWGRRFDRILGGQQPR
jgi:coenzyme F420-reducing hydrogenase beta subunit